MNKNSFRKVFDRANRRVRGLWIRNGSYYRQVTVIDSQTGLKKTTRIRLEGAENLDGAKAEAAKLKDRISQGQAVFGKLGPDFKTFREHYKSVIHKAPKTMSNEEHFLKQWEQFLGPETRIGAITPQNVLAYRGELLERKLAARTVNLHTRALRQLLKLAKLEGHIGKLATEGIKQLKEKQVEKRLFSTEELGSVVAEALKHHNRSGKQFADFVLLCMYSGGRMSEVLGLRWENVDWKNEQLVFQGDVTKNSESRRVDFNPNLHQHLLCMKSTANSEFLFPSCRTDNPVTSFKKILNEVRADLELFDLTFHSLRHYFISMCVMSGVDYLTIARWVGHKDGGVLIGKVYGHLNSAHTAQMAKKVKL